MLPEEETARVTFGIMFSGILSGLSLSIWVLFHGYSIPVALAVYPLAGTLGALLFLAFALTRSQWRAPRAQKQAATQAQ